MLKRSEFGCKNKISPNRLLAIATALIVAAIAQSGVVVVHAQDGSSELTPEKTASSMGIRTRVRCTDESLKLYANATACADEREPESCRMIFSLTASSNPATRDPKCDNPLLKDLAEQCRRTCAICCEDPSYSCQNDESGIVNCNQNMEKCGMAEFSTMMVKFCPATCGLCLAKRCHDQIASEDCRAMQSLCTNEIYSTFMEHQCARTCGKCKPEDGSDLEPEEHGASGGSSVGKKKISELSTGGGGSGGGEERPESGAGGGGRERGGNEVDRLESLERLEKPDEEVEEKEPVNKVQPPKRKEKCVDLIKTCTRNKRFCHHPNYMVMMKKNCAKTCGYCKPDDDDVSAEEHETGGGAGHNKHEGDEHETGTTGGGGGRKHERPERKKSEKSGRGSGHNNKRGTLFGGGGGGNGGDGHHIVTRECHDEHPFCKGWAKNGYCDSDDYTDQEKKEKCAKSCNLC